MKTIVKVLINSILMFCSLNSFAQSADAQSAMEQATRFWKMTNSETAETTIEPMQGSISIVAWLVESDQNGFVIISADSSLRPILAYGDDLSGLSAEQYQIWSSLLVADYEGRLKAVANGFSPSEKQLWMRQEDRTFQQWPPEGSTSTGGWLKTNWTQTSPYNKLCPMDLNAGSRSVVGCPATAMAQIFNYFNSINNTRFDDSDDYYHNYGSGNKYWIDDDFVSRDFPSFPRLNQWFDTIEYCYSSGTSLTDSMKAALSFAAGIAAQQVYTASVSGTFGIDQAQMAVQRFGFDQSELLVPPDFSIQQRVSDNMKNALPDLLGLVNEGWTVGHNVVVDGYNTNDFFHFNFGWGGSSNGWYTLPPTSIPYDLTVIEGVIVDILSSTADIANKPVSEAVRISTQTGGNLMVFGMVPGQTYQLQLFTIGGVLLMENQITASQQSITFNPGNMDAGMYLCRIISENQQQTFRVAFNP
jgi:hypothetical protein